MRLPRPVRYGLVGAGLFATWVMLLRIGGMRCFSDLVDGVLGAMAHALGPAGGTGSVVVYVRSVEMLLLALAGATLAAPLGFVVRASARGRMRATGRDLLAPLRGYLAGRPWWARAPLWGPAALAVALTTFDRVGRRFGGGWVVFGAVVALPWAVALTALVRRASKIAVGLDGVLVQGTSRRRFFAYRDLEAAELNASGEIVLRAAGRDRLKLQIAGSDADRIDAILARIRDGIARAHAQAGDGAQRFAEAATRAALARAAHGRADYRGRAVSREELLAIVESPATASEGRAAAARALGRAADADEGARLRIAAERCAEPATRAVLLRIAAEEEAEAEHAAEQERREGKQVRVVR